MHDVSDERDRPTRPGVAGRRNRRQQAERRHERERPQHLPPGRAGGERDDRSDGCEAELEAERLSELRLEHGIDRVPAESLRESEPSGNCPLEHDAKGSGDDEADSEPCEDPVEAGAKLSGRRAKDEGECRGTAHHEQHQREVESSRELEESIHVTRRALAEHLLAGAGTIRRPDVEDEGSGDRVRIGGDNSPRDRVRTLWELSAERDGHRALVGPGDLSGIDTRPAAVEEPDRPERRLHGLAEAQRDRRRAAPDDRVVARRALNQGCVRERGRRCRQGDKGDR